MDELAKLFCYEDNIEISGLTNELNIFYINEKFKMQNKNMLVVTNTLFEANKIFEGLKTYNENVLLFPMDDFITSVAIAISPDLKVKRLETIEKVFSKEKYIIVTNLMGYLRFLPHLNSETSQLKLKTRARINRDNLVEKLNLFGYERDSLVSKTGSFAVRGYIIDIFPLNETHPVRIEFYGNNVESIRFFDEETQISIKKVENISITPFVEIITDEKYSLCDICNNPHVIYYDLNQIKYSYSKLYDEMREYSDKYNVDINSLMFLWDEINVVKSTTINVLNSTSATINYESKEIDSFEMNLDLLKKFVERQLNNHKTVVFCLSSINQLNILKEVYPDILFNSQIKRYKLNALKKQINKGFIIEDYVFISEFDIDKNNLRRIKYFNNLRVGKKIKGFDDLEKGDYIVHIIHGIGIYNGVITLVKNGCEKDYIQLIYKDNDKVYLPVEKIESLYKYTSKEGALPKLSKLGTSTWEKTKQSVRSKINDITDELIKLYSEREKINGPIFANQPEIDVFASEFEYEATPDQVKAIKEVLGDLSLKKPMDRLLCGDVGFGKTEVAFRAAFKTIVNDYQVAYLCPTTILSNQHYENAIKRFKNHPINIALLNRFTPKKEVKRILKDLSEGKIDMLIGTHRILSKDIKFHQLGLLIVDEEQRFGVTHKEKIKQLKEDVNVLTLSATPIPRTLKFALSGLRDLSLIDTAPVNRYPVQTYVINENDLLIKDAIYKELTRCGQVFILYNNIDQLEKKCHEINNLVPMAKIKIAHGQMNKEELEKIMKEFINGEFDVLLCTTIIETGIDIPNVNTLIIFDSDRFGLSQLYQIRGRVGRSDRIAYAYLMYKENKMLNDIAVKRLQAIKEFTELGSGYKIAMRDLSLRGAGDLLGSDQAGFVSSVGIDLYLRMIEEKVNNTEPMQTNDEDQNILDVSTHIKNEYVSDENIKIEIHKLISTIDSYDKLLMVKEELEDRFGLIDENMLIYMHEEWFEKLANKLGIKRTIQTGNSIELELSLELSNKISSDKLFLQASNISQNFKFKYFNKRIHIILIKHNLKMHYIFYLTKLLSDLYQE